LFGGEFLNKREDVVRLLPRLLDKLVIPIIIKLFLRGAECRCSWVVVGIEKMEVLANLESRDKV
jgi:hypothetical protein